MKKIYALMLALFLGLGTFALPAMAGHDGHGAEQKMCKMCDKKDCDGMDCDYDCPITAKIMKKAKFFLANQKEIGLSDEQVAQIKAIKLETKKGYIRTKAEMEVFMLDLDAKLSEPKIDEAAIGTMFDSASAGWSTGMKSGVATYLKLKAVLNEAQMAKAKEIWSKQG